MRNKKKENTNFVNMKKILLLIILVAFSGAIIAQNASFKRVSADTLKALNQTNKKIYAKDTLLVTKTQTVIDTTASKPVTVNVSTGEIERTWWRTAASASDTSFLSRSITRGELFPSNIGDKLSIGANHTQQKFGVTGSVRITDSLILEKKLLGTSDSILIMEGNILKYRVFALSGTSYGYVTAYRPSKVDTLISAAGVDGIGTANTNKFPAGTYFIFHKGSYAPTVNLARDNCIYYLEDGAIITKTTAGAMFDCTGFTNPIRILGYGDFYKTTNTGDILTNTTAADIIFEANICNSTTDDIINSQTTGIAFNYKISIKNAETSAGSVFYDNSNTIGFATLNIDKAASTNTYAIYLASSVKSNFLINSNNITGVTYGVYSVGCAGYVCRNCKVVPRRICSCNWKCAACIN